MRVLSAVLVLAYFAAERDKGAGIAMCCTFGDTTDIDWWRDLGDSTPDIDDECKRLLVERRRARDNKNWVNSDELRDELLNEYGVVVKDTAHDTLWAYADEKPE